MISQISSIVLGWLVCCLVASAELPEVTNQAISEWGDTVGVPQLTGMVFIEGRYLPPPYTVTRRGNAILINRIQVVYAFFDVDQTMPKNLPEAGGTPAITLGDNDVAETQSIKPPSVITPEAQATKRVTSIADLFSDDKPQEALAPISPSMGASQEAPSVPEQQPMTPSQIREMKSESLARLEHLRSRYEMGLSQGEVFFFSQRHNHVNGTQGTARQLIGVLPEALRYAQSPLDLQTRLQQGGIYFLDLTICAAIFENRNTFPLLVSRLEKIERAEENEIMRRKQLQRR